MKKRVKGIAETVGFDADDLAELKLEELLDSPPPGLDEAMALAKVIQFVSGEDYAKFSRIIFDTAPTGPPAESHAFNTENLRPYIENAESARFCGWVSYKDHEAKKEF